MKTGRVFRSELGEDDVYFIQFVDDDLILADENFTLSLDQTQDTT